MNTMLASDLPLPLIGRGKVRDIYAVGDDRVLLLTTDRISAFDVVMAETIPMKGAVLTQISAVNSALQSVALGLLDEHLNHCVTQAVADGGEEADQKLAEASAAIARLVRS